MSFHEFLKAFFIIFSIASDILWFFFNLIKFLNNYLITHLFLNFIISILSWKIIISIADYAMMETYPISAVKTCFILYLSIRPIKVKVNVADI